MKPDTVEISWDTDKNKWMVRIQIGGEVIRRYCDKPKDADEQTLRATAEKTAVDEGYKPEPADISVRR